MKNVPLFTDNVYFVQQLVVKILPLGSCLFVQVVITNTVPHDLQRFQCTKVRSVDISLVIAESIRRIHFGESMSHLFKNVPVED